MIQTHVLNYSLHKTVGEISDVKIKKICENGFNLLTSVNGQFAHFNDVQGRFLLVISQNQITCVPAPDNIDRFFTNPGQVVDTVSSIMDILLLDDYANLELAMDRSYPGIDNTFQRSISLLREDFPSGIGSEAIGFRIPFSKNEFQGEMRIEPFFSNPSRYFLGCKIVTKQPCLLGDAANMWDIMTKLITEEFEPLAKRLFNGES